MKTCPRCRRPESPGNPDYIGTCHGVECANCLVAAAAYRAGVLRGVEIAREYIEPVGEGRKECLGPLGWRWVHNDWSDVDRAVREEVGDD